MDDLLSRYNYDEFVPEKFQPWMRFHESPPVGLPGPDFPLWTIENEETSLREIIARRIYTIVEFGSFT